MEFIKHWEGSEDNLYLNTDEDGFTVSSDPNEGEERIMEIEVQTTNSGQKATKSVQIIQLSANTTNKWAGIPMIFFGDSITPNNYVNRYPPFPTDAGWPQRVAAYFKSSQCLTRGIGGQKMVANSATWYANSEGEYVNRPPAEQPEGTTVHLGAFCSWDRITTMIPQNFKGLILANGGANDAFAGNAGETIEEERPLFDSANTLDALWISSGFYPGGDYDISQFKGAVCSMIMKMQTWAPESIIVLCTPLAGRENEWGNAYNPPINNKGLMMRDYADAIMDIGKFMGIPAIDLNGTAGINMINRSLFISDVIHPNSTTGQEAIARAVIAGISQVLPRAWDETPQVAIPSIIPSGGTYMEAQSVTVSCATDGATIRYTIDGSTPDSNSAIYSSAISVSSSMTIKARAFKQDMTDSAVSTAVFVINQPATGYWKHYQTGVETAIELVPPYFVDFEGKKRFSSTLPEWRLLASEVKLPEGTQTILPGIGNDDYPNLEVLDLPATIENLGSGFLNQMTKVTNITIRATTPPSVSLGSPNSPGLKVYVPSGSLALYKSTSPYNNFSSLIFAIP